MKIATAYVEVRPDTDKFGADLHKQVEGQARTAGVRISSIIGGALVAGGIKKSIDAASDLNETLNVTTLVFGKADKEAIKFAEDAEQGLGLSKRAALDALAGFGGMLQNLGFMGPEVTDLSKKLTTLAGDLGSAFNTDTAEAQLAISAALRGENEQIQRYNVFLTDAAVRQEAVRLGLAKTTAAVDLHGKAQATLSLILKQTDKYQGDFANTADSVANSQKRAQAASENAAADLGSNFLPIYQKLVDVVGGAAQVFGALPGPIQTGVVALAGIAAAVGPVKAGLEGLRSVTTAAGKGLEKAALKSYDLAGSLPSLSTALVGIGTVAGLVGIALAANARDAEKLRNAARELRREAEATGESLEDTLVDKLVETFAESSDVSKAMDALGVSFRDLRAPVTGSKADVKAWADELRASTPANAAAQEEARLLIARVFELNDGLREARRVEGEASGAKKELGLAAGNTADKIDDETSALDKAKDALDRYKAGVDRAFASSTFEEVVDRRTSALDDLSDDIADRARKVDDLQREIQDARSAAVDREADIARRLADAKRDLAEAQEDGNDRVAEATQKLAEAKADEDWRTRRKRIAEAEKDLAKAVKDRDRSVGDAQRNVAETTEDAARSRQETAKQITDLQRQLAEAQADASLALEGNTDAALRNRAAVRGVVEESANVITAARDQGKSLEDLQRIRDTEIENLKTQLRQMGYNEEGIRHYIDQLNLIPLDKTTVLNVKIVPFAGDVLQDDLDKAIEDFYNTHPELRPPGYASGTLALPDGYSTVGESGAETIYKRGSQVQVLSHAETQQMTGGGDTIINLGAGATATDVAVIERAVERVQRRKAWDL